MSHPSMASLMDVELQPGKPPLVRAETGADPASWAAGHRTALRAAVAEHGSVLIRGLGLHDAAETSAVFQRLAVRLMPEKEAFAPREPHAGGLYSADRKSTRLNSSHSQISYAVFCLKKKRPKTCGPGIAAGSCRPRCSARTRTVA